MNAITVRFMHLESHVLVLELEGVEASATVGALRELLMERLASEEACMMRMFVKWHAQIVLPGGQKRLIELTDEDECEPLDSHGISHLSEVHLDGPLTGDSNEYSQLMLTERVEGYRLLAEARETRRLLGGTSTEIGKLSTIFTIDRNTPHTSVIFNDDLTTASKLSQGFATLRASQPLTSNNHKWAVRIIEDAGATNIIIGLLPKLSDVQVAQMECGSKGFIGSGALGGFGMQGGG